MSLFSYQFAKCSSEVINETKNLTTNKLTKLGLMSKLASLFFPIIIIKWPQSVGTFCQFGWV